MKHQFRLFVVSAFVIATTIAVGGPWFTPAAAAPTPPHKTQVVKVVPLKFWPPKIIAKDPIPVTALPVVTAPPATTPPAPTPPPPAPAPPAPAPPAPVAAPAPVSQSTPATGGGGWNQVAICEEGGRNDPTYGYFGAMPSSWAGYDGYPLAGDAPWSVQVAWGDMINGGPPWAPAGCAAAGYRGW